MPLFAVIDPVAVPRGEDLNEAMPGGVSLGRMRVDEPAPPGGAHLVPAEGDGRQALAGFVARSALVHWGILLSSTAPMAEVRRHLRRFLLVGMPKGGEVYFRFYDPRVLSVFLPTCSVDQLQTFFGPADTYWALSEEASAYTEYRLVNDRLIQRQHGAKGGLPADLFACITPDGDRVEAEA